MKLCMIGTGYVGLVSGVCFSDLGNTVYCVDKDKTKIKLLNSGIIPIYEPGLEEIVKRNYNKKRLIFTTNLKEAIKNSGLETTSINFFVFCLLNIFSILSPVVTGTVDLVTITL